MKKLLIVTLVSSLVGLANAGDAVAGKTKSVTCVACHGAEGVSAIPMYPNLAGQKEAYIVKSLKDFKTDARKDPTMGAMAKPLSDDDIANLAAYYAGLGK